MHYVTSRPIADARMCKHDSSVFIDQVSYSLNVFFCVWFSLILLVLWELNCSHKSYIFHWFVVQALYCANITAHCYAMWQSLSGVSIRLNLLLAALRLKRGMLCRDELHVIPCAHVYYRVSASLLFIFSCAILKMTLCLIYPHLSLSIYKYGTSPLPLNLL